MTRITGFFKHNAIALAALFIALGGTSYAAVAIPKNSVGARQLRKNAVTAKKIHSGAITPGKLSDKAFGGRILYMAEIASAGEVIESSPRGVKTQGWTNGSGGVVVFPHPLPPGCWPLAGEGSHTPAAQTPSISAAVDRPVGVQVQMSGPAFVTLVIVCGH